MSQSTRFHQLERNLTPLLLRCKFSSNISLSSYPRVGRAVELVAHTSLSPWQFTITTLKRFNSSDTNNKKLMTNNFYKESDANVKQNDLPFVQFDFVYTVVGRKPQ